MDIKHTTVTNIDKVIETYKNTDGEDIVYVCTTDLVIGEIPVDVFYRKTPHPTFKNNYFGIFLEGENIKICNADLVTNLHFGVVENDEGMLEYSRSPSETKVFSNGNEIGGGRMKITSNAPVDIYKIRDGRLQLEAKFDEYDTVSEPAK